MPFDPTFPPTSQPLVSAQFRDQFNGLKDLLDAQATQITDLIGVVDSLTAELALVPPGAAEIIDIYSNDVGLLHIEIAAHRATDIRVWRKGPSDPDFVVTTTGGLVYDESGLESGTHNIKVAGVNAGGAGLEAITDVAVI